VYEAQVQEYMRTFQIPKDYQARILEAQPEIEEENVSYEAQKGKLERQLGRVKDLYELGDNTKAEYLTKRDAVLTQMESLKPRVREPRHLDRLAEFLADIPAAWETATQEQRNKLAKALFDQVWLQDKAVVAVKPRLELEPFFALNYEEFLSEHQSVEGVILGNHMSGVPIHRSAIGRKPQCPMQQPTA
jgi:hypothetical protein